MSRLIGVLMPCAIAIALASGGSAWGAAAPGPAEKAPPQHGRAAPETRLFSDDGVFPNSRLPVLIYRGVLATPEAAGPRAGHRPGR